MKVSLYFFFHADKFENRNFNFLCKHFEEKERKKSEFGNGTISDVSNWTTIVSL